MSILAPVLGFVTVAETRVFAWGKVPLQIRESRFKWLA